MNKGTVEEYASQVREELENILSFWKLNTPDYQNGGFYGKLDASNTVFPQASKGSVLNSRILWSFSAAFALTGNKEHRLIAERAFEYFKEHFIDPVFGGVYWNVSYKGDLFDTKKQIYALAFAVYGLSEYYRCCRLEEAKVLAIQLYHAIIEHSYDTVNGGYIEALSREWKPITDLRLSAKDANEKKSMNTHLHLLEGFANLYSIWPDESLRQRIAELINIFITYIIHPQTGHLILFFDEEWKPQGDIQSYGHDIEAAWLIQEAAEIINDKPLVEKSKELSAKIADAASEGLDNDGGLWYEYDAGRKHLVKEKHWWPQAEAMVGYFNIWQATGRDSYLRRSLKSWEFIKKHMLDKVNGEWHWGITAAGVPMKGEDKVGIWKCPYHNSRACMEIIKRSGRSGLTV